MAIRILFLICKAVQTYLIHSESARGIKNQYLMKVVFEKITEFTKLSLTASCYVNGRKLVYVTFSSVFAH